MSTQNPQDIFDEKPVNVDSIRASSDPGSVWEPFNNNYGLDEDVEEEQEDDQNNQNNNRDRRRDRKEKEEPEESGEPETEPAGESIGEPIEGEPLAEEGLEGAGEAGAEGLGEVGMEGLGETGVEAAGEAGLEAGAEGLGTGAATTATAGTAGTATTATAGAGTAGAVTTATAGTAGAVTTTTGGVVVTGTAVGVGAATGVDEVIAIIVLVVGVIVAIVFVVFIIAFVALPAAKNGGFGTEDAQASDFVVPADIKKYCDHDYGFYNNAQTFVLFGSTPQEIAKNSTTVVFLGHRVAFHKKAAPCLDAVSKEFKATGKKYDIRAIGTSRTWTVIPGSGTISMHCFNVAIDLNPDTNPYCNSYHVGGPCTNGNNGPTTDMPPELIKAFKNYGFNWGGEWNSAKDNMHFEWHGANPADL